MLIASEPGAHTSVAGSLASLGGEVRYRDDELAYIRVQVPVAAAEKAARLDGIAAVNLDQVIPLENPRPEAAENPAAVPAPGPGTPAVNPYLPSKDIGGPQFMQANPTYDGRGVVIGILDTGIDLLTPELQTAKLRNGANTRKIVDWVTYTDPLGDGDPTWINMATEVTVAGGTFTVDGVTYTAPGRGEGPYRFGIFREADLGEASEFEADVNRDGATDGAFAVLWNTRGNRVWVDVNQDHSFADEKAMTDYKEEQDIGIFGTDDPSTDVRESVPFVIQTDRKNMYVNIGIVSGSHGTHVAGIAAGKGFFGGAFNGVAPEARIVSVRVCLFVSGCTGHALIEGMIYAAKTAKVDVINLSIGGLPALNDGDDTRAVLYNRLIDKYKAQMFISAGNSGPGINTVGDPSVAQKAMSVGAYVTKDTWHSNYGAAATRAEGLFVFSSRGPAENGGFKPNIVAPGAAISSVPAWQPGQPVGGTYSLPPGYGMYNGTSMAAPQATGGAALLLSAARQTGMQIKPDQLRQAIMSTTRFVPGVAAHEQGTGLFQVGEAWTLLKRRHNDSDTTISSAAPVNTVISGYLATPNSGPGIYEREGWSPGQSGARTITFTRTDGERRPVTYNLSWLGNDGTFSGPPSVTLPLNTPASISVNVAPAAAGVHSAILRLDDPSEPGVEYQVMNTVVAAQQMTLANNFTATSTGSADRPDMATFFFNVPANTPAFKADLQAAGSARLRLIRFHPYGIPIEAPGYQTGGVQSRTVTNPAPGVWEVTVDNSRASAVSQASFTIAGSLLGVDVTPAAWTQSGVHVGDTLTNSFSFTNRFGPFTGAAAGTALGSALKARPNIASGGAQQVYDVNVPAGSNRISAQIGNASDTSADLDLFLFDCTSGSCVMASSSTSGSSEEFVAAENPAAGLWKVLVDPYSVPAGATDYDYLDVIANPVYGSVSVSDTPAPHANGATWTASATATVSAEAGAGRFLRGFVQVRSGSTVLGGAEVSLTN